MKIRAAEVRLKRAYQPPAADDGTRVLVDRLWPRGVAKADAALDLWLKEIAPSTGLRHWLGTTPRSGSNFASVMCKSCVGTPSW